MRPTPRHARTSSLAKLPMILVVVISVLMLGSIASTIAQQGVQLQANPTEAPDGPGGFQIAATNTPTPRITEEPEPPDRLQANPTDTPTPRITEEATVDDIRVNPTEAPSIDDIQGNPVTGTVRVIKRDCPPSVAGDSLLGGELTDYLPICTQPHDGVEFVMNDANGAEAGVTANGVVEWTGVDTGPFAIVETIPAGYGNPIVFCGFTESPGGGVQHPSLQPSPGGTVSGTFPNQAFEYVCYWMNVKTSTVIPPGPDSVTNPEGGSFGDLQVIKRACPFDIARGEAFAYYLETCTEAVDGIQLTLTDQNGASTKEISDGMAVWDTLSEGPFTIQESIPAQYGDPIVFCGWNALYEGVAYDAFSQQVPSADGLVEGEVIIPNTHYTCHYFNTQSGPGSFTDAESLTNNLLVRKWTCPEGTLQTQDQDYYWRVCELLYLPVEFTLSHANGDDTQSTSAGFARWSNIPLGEFELAESVPAGYGKPVVFCGWWAEYDGFIYDAFPQLVILAGVVVEGAITIPNTEYMCDWFNIEGGIDDLQANPTEAPGIDDFQANPTAVPGIDDEAIPTTGTVRVIKRDCPLGIVEDAALSDYLELCPQHHDGVEFTLNEADGPRDGTTAGGQVQWTGVNPGAFDIQETLPAGYTDPIVFCGFTESPGGGVQHPALQTATGGTVSGTFPDTMFEYVCYWMNIKDTGQVGTGPGGVANPQGGGGQSTLLVRKHVCPFGTSLDLNSGEYGEVCTSTLDGVQVTVTHANGTSTKPITGGQAQWDGLPVGPISIQEAIPGGFGDPIVVCLLIAYPEDGNLIFGTLSFFKPAPNGQFDLGIPNALDVQDIATTNITCSMYNMPLQPGSYAAAEDTTNTLVARKWLCPAGIDRSLHLLELFERCALSDAAVGFTLTNAGGTFPRDTAGGQAQWDDVPLGPFTLEETVPAGYEEPFTWCGWTAFHNGAVYDAFHMPVPSPGGVVKGEISVPNTHFVCHFFNAEVAIDDFQANPTEAPDGPGGFQANPTETPGIDSLAIEADLTNGLTARKWLCPGSTYPSQDLDYLKSVCTLSAMPVEFTLTNDDGASTSATAGGWTTWDNVPLGPFTLEETVPDGYDEPITSCGWTAFYEGAVYDGFPEFVPSPGGVVEGEITVPNTSYACDFFNIGTSHWISVRAVACPEGLNPTDNYWSGNNENECGANTLAGVPVSLTNDGGTLEGETDELGVIRWDFVDLGDGTIQIQQDTPEGFGEPTVWCVSFPVVAGDAQDFEYVLAPAIDGMITVQPEQHFPYRFSCIFYNIPESERQQANRQ